MSPHETTAGTAGEAPAAATASRSGGGSWLDKLLNVFAEVRPGEGTTAVLLMANVFLLLAGYYLLKTIREPLVLAAEGGGAEVKSYASAAIAGLLIVLVPLYGALASRVSRVKLIKIEHWELQRMKKKLPEVYEKIERVAEERGTGGD